MEPFPGLNALRSQMMAIDLGSECASQASRTAQAMVYFEPLNDSYSSIARFRLSILRNIAAVSRAASEVAIERCWAEGPIRLDANWRE
jgi:hypothetical protein